MRRRHAQVSTHPQDTPKVSQLSHNVRFSLMEFVGLAESPCALWLHLIMPDKRDQWVQPRYTPQSAEKNMYPLPDILTFSR